MNIFKKLIAAAVAVLPLATFAQTDINFEDNTKYTAVGVYDSWEDSPFRANPALGNCQVVDNEDATSKESANTSAKVLGFQRSIHGSNMFGARVDLAPNQRFVLTPTVQYVHVMMKKPKAGRSMLIGLGKHNSNTSGYADTWANQELCEQFTALSNNKAAEGQWTDVVFPVKGAGNIDIHSLVVVPDCEDPSSLTDDFIVYLDDIKVNNSSAPTVALVGDYPVCFEKDQAYTRTDRHLDRLTVTTALGAFTKNASAKMYTEVIDGFIPVKQGEQVKVQMSYTGSWMHSFYYLDKDQNGKFEVLDTEDTELVAASYGDNGSHASDYGLQQTFTIPANLQPGIYRLRGKVDWMSTDPAGNDGSAGNFIVDNGGGVIDVLLNVYSDAAVSVNNVQRNGDIVLANGADIDNLTQPVATPLKVKARPAPGFDYAGMIIHIGYGGEPIHGNPQSMVVNVPWQDFDKDDCYTIPAAYFTAPVVVEGDMVQEGSIDKNTSGGNTATVFNGLKVSPAPSATAFDANTVWYTIANQQTDQTGYLSIERKNGNSLATTTTAKDETDAGLWCIVGEEATGFKFYNKAAGPTKVLSNNANAASGMVDASTTANVTFIYNERTAGGGVWNIKDFGSTNNYWCGSNNKLGHWDSSSAANDNNCRWIFEEVVVTPVTPVEPTSIFSTAENPVFWGLKFNNATAYISDKGEGELAETTGNFVTGWAFIGNADSFKLLSNKGRYAGVKRATATNGQTDNLVYTLADATNAVTFKIVNDNGSTFEIAQTTAANKTFNPWGGKGAGKSIGFWTADDANNKLVRVDIKDIEHFVNAQGAATFAKPSKHTLWYNEPAPTDYAGWQEYSLPIGNGEFGGSIFGGVGTDKITFNEKSLWDGNSSTRDNGVHGEYLKFGSIWVTDRSEGIADGVTDYVRYLDIDNAIAGVEYTGADHNRYTRTFFASQPAKALIGEYKAEGPATLDLTFSVVPGGQMVSRSTTKPSVRYNADGSATFNGKLELLSYAAQFTVKGDDGAVIEATDGGIRIKGTSTVRLYVAGATDFDAWNNESGLFTNGHAAQLPAEVKACIDAAATKTFDALRAEATAEYRQWMDRVNFDLKKEGQSVDSEKTTKDLINAYTHNTDGIRNTAEGLFLEQLYYNYGRYLLISSNRYAPVPNNLQGLWVDTDSGHAPWNSDIHTNINIQMNYWPAEQNNLSELHMPLLNHIKSIASSPGCLNQAKAKNATVGWVVDTESNLFGGMSNWSDNYTIANAWYCTHLWQHYRFTKDKQFLADYFPVMWSAAQYWAERMVPSTNGDGTYECPSEYSPEHGPQAENATAHSQQLVNELFANTLEAIEILGNETSLDATWLSKVRDRAKKSDSGLRTETYASSSGWGTTYLAYGEPILKEWKYSAFTRGANAHRHTSHLMCLYPFGQVSYFSDDATGKALAVAARNSLAQRSDASTGWAMGWRVNLWARTLDGNHARTMINNAIVHAGSGVNYSSGGVYYNLWDAHTPFQIDGNFGVCAGISEMLIQSYDDTIHLLPALPDAWTDGTISGLKAVGNFTVSESWADGRLTEASVTSVKGGELRVQYGKELLIMTTYPGETYNLYFNDGTFSSHLAGATIVNVAEHINAALHGRDTLDGINAAANAVLQRR